MLKVSFFSEIILYRPYLAPLFQSVMALQTPIHVAKFVYLQADRPEAPINTGLAGSPSGDARFTRAARQAAAGRMGQARAGWPQRSGTIRRPEARVFWAFQPGRFRNPCQSGVCELSGCGRS